MLIILKQVWDLDASIGFCRNIEIIFNSFLSISEMAESIQKVGTVIKLLGFLRDKVEKGRSSFWLNKLFSLRSFAVVMDSLRLISKIIKEILIEILFQKGSFLLKSLIIYNIYFKMFRRRVIFELMGRIFEIDELGGIKASLLSSIRGIFVLDRGAHVLIVRDFLVVFGGFYWLILAFHRNRLAVSLWVNNCDKVQQTNSFVVMLELRLKQTVPFDLLNENKVFLDYLLDNLVQNLNKLLIPKKFLKSFRFLLTSVKPLDVFYYKTQAIFEL